MEKPRFSINFFSGSHVFSLPWFSDTLAYSLDCFMRSIGRIVTRWKVFLDKIRTSFSVLHDFVPYFTILIGPSLCQIIKVSQWMAAFIFFDIVTFYLRFHKNNLTVWKQTNHISNGRYDNDAVSQMDFDEYTLTLFVPYFWLPIEIWS